MDSDGVEGVLPGTFDNYLLFNYQGFPFSCQSSVYSDTQETFEESSNIRRKKMSTDQRGATHLYGGVSDDAHTLRPASIHVAVLLTMTL